MGIASYLASLKNLLHLQSQSYWLIFVAKIASSLQKVDLTFWPPGLKRLLNSARLKAAPDVSEASQVFI